MRKRTLPQDREYLKESPHFTKRKSKDQTMSKHIVLPANADGVAFIRVPAEMRDRASSVR